MRVFNINSGKVEVQSFELSAYLLLVTPTHFPYLATIRAELLKDKNVWDPNFGLKMSRK